MVSSVLNEGARGVQTSQREMYRAANEISRANVRTDASPTEKAPNEASPIAPVEESKESEGTRDISEPLIELRRQELIFKANAEVISTGNKALGSLLDTQA